MDEGRFDGDHLRFKADGKKTVAEEDGSVVYLGSSMAGVLVQLLADTATTTQVCS